MSVHRLRQSVPRLSLNKQEAAEALGVSVDHFERHIRRHIPYVTAGSLRLYSVAALQRWLDDEATLHGRRLSRAKRL